MGQNNDAELGSVQRIRNPLPENIAESQRQEDAWCGRGDANGSVRLKVSVCSQGVGEGAEDKDGKRGRNKKSETH